MLLTLLQHGGQCSETDIAKAISVHDPTQIEYYEAITRNMVGRVLTRHGVVKRDGKRFSLLSAQMLTKDQRAELRRLLETKLDQYVAKRGERIWQHRKLALGDISGTVKYEVLRRASLCCELCGVSNRDRALEVDHIVPRNHGGSDDEANLQALCYSCNAMRGIETPPTSGRCAIPMPIVRKPSVLRATKGWAHRTGERAMFRD